MTLLRLNVKLNIKPRNKLKCNIVPEVSHVIDQLGARGTVSKNEQIIKKCLGLVVICGHSAALLTGA